jgi:hypothetical protein
MNTQGVDLGEFMRRVMFCIWVTTTTKDSEELVIGLLLKKLLKRCVKRQSRGRKPIYNESNALKYVCPVLKWNSKSISKRF